MVACLLHNPEVHGSKPTKLVFFKITLSCISANLNLYFVSFVILSSADIAQLVEHWTEDLEISGSIPGPVIPAAVKYKNSKYNFLNN